MKQETRAIIENAANRRAVVLRKQDPSSEVAFQLDENFPRAVVKIKSGGKVRWLEFIESSLTVGDASNMEDYAFCAEQFGGLTLLFPESLYPREIAATIFEDIRKRIIQAGFPDIQLNGLVYDDMGNTKKAL